MKKECVPHGCRVWLALFVAGGMAWATPAADWAGDDVTLGANDAQERVEVPSGASGKTFKTLTVAGDYALAGASWLKAETLSVPTGGRLTLSQDGVVRTRHLRLTLKGHPSEGEGVSHPNGIALAEIALCQNGARIPWPEGTAILASEYADYPSQGHSDDCLIDDDLGTKWFWDKAPADGECTITLDAPEGGRFVFDGYILAMADQNGRNPLTWELAVSEDGEVWETLDRLDLGLEAILALPTNDWMGEEPLAVEPKDAATNGFLIEAGTAEIAGTLAGAGRLVGSVAFAEGATLEVAEGHHPTLVGTASGAPRLDVPEGLLSQTTNLPVIAAPEGLAQQQGHRHRRVPAPPRRPARRLGGCHHPSLLGRGLRGRLRRRAHRRQPRDQMVLGDRQGRTLGAGVRGLHAHPRRRRGQDPHLRRLPPGDGRPQRPQPPPLDTRSQRRRPDVAHPRRAGLSLRGGPPLAP